MTIFAFNSRLAETCSLMQRKSFFMVKSIKRKFTILLHLWLSSEDNEEAAFPQQTLRTSNLQAQNFRGFAKYCRSGQLCIQLFPMGVINCDGTWHGNKTPGQWQSMPWTTIGIQWPCFALSCPSFLWHGRGLNSSRIWWFLSVRSGEE